MSTPSSSSREVWERIQMHHQRYQLVWIKMVGLLQTLHCLPHQKEVWRWIQMHHWDYRLLLIIVSTMVPPSLSSSSTFGGVIECSRVRSPKASTLLMKKERHFHHCVFLSSAIPFVKTSMTHQENQMFMIKYPLSWIPNWKGIRIVIVLNLGLKRFRGTCAKHMSFAVSSVNRLI